MYSLSRMATTTGFSELLEAFHGREVIDLRLDLTGLDSKSWRNLHEMKPGNTIVC